MAAWADPERFRALAGRAQRVGAELTPAQYGWRPAPDAWSIAQVLDHLNRSGEPLLPRLQAAVADAPAGETPPWSPKGLERWFLKAVGPGAGGKTPVPPRFVPGAAPDGAEALRRFAALQEALAACAGAAAQKNVARIRVPSAAMPLLRLRVPAWLESTRIHEDYHLGQAEALRRHPGFPAAL